MPGRDPMLCLLYFYPAFQFRLVYETDSSILRFLYMFRQHVLQTAHTYHEPPIYPTIRRRPLADCPTDQPLIEWILKDGFLIL